MTFESSTTRDNAASNQDVRSDLLRFVQSRVSDGESIAVDTDLLEAEVLDSLLIMDLVAYIESTHSVKLENADIAPRHFRTVESLSRLVAERKS